MAISYDEFKKVEVKVGQILSAEKIPDTDKLLKLSVDFGMKKVEMTSIVVDPLSPVVMPVEEKDIRQIVSGIALHYTDPAVLVGKKVAFVTNLEPRKIKGFESNGMILAVSGEGFFSLLEVNEIVPPGSSAS